MDSDSAQVTLDEALSMLDEPTSSKKPRLEPCEDQRNNYYGYADNAFIDAAKEFIERQEKRVLEELGQNEYIELLVQWRKWFDQYLSAPPKSTEDLLRDMPQSWSVSEPLPIATIVTEGDAGTGKTFSINTLMRTLADGTVSSFCRRGTDAYLNYAINDTIPNGMSHVIENNTMCKMFKIRFSHESVRQRLNEIRKDQELEASYRRFLHLEPHTATDDGQHARNMTRQHFALAAFKMWPIVTNCHNEMLKDFFKHNTAKFRRTVLDKMHPHYTGDDLVPALLVKHHNTLKNAYKGNGSQDMSCEEAKKRVRFSESVLEQDTYRLAVAMGQTSSGVKAPPHAALFPVMLFEEDGMAPAMKGDLRKMLIMLTQFLYLPPYSFSRVPVIISSGSTTQSNAIDCVASALQMSSTPFHLKDKENVLAYRAEFFRRDKNDFQAPDVLACRATCMTLERCLPASEFTYSSMLTREEHPSLINDPGFLPDGTRLYRRHRDVSLYTDKIARIGKANLPITDVVFVADNIVPTRPTQEAVVTTSLSKLSEAQALKNRLHMWTQKSSLYKNEELDSEVKLPDCYTIDAGCKSNMEETITRMRSSRATNLKRKYEKEGKSMTEDELEETFLMSHDTGAILASDETFQEDIQENVLYDNMINHRATDEDMVQLSRKRQKTMDGSTAVITTKCEKKPKQASKKKPLTFIVGRARDLLSEDEHRAKRQHAVSIAQKLKKGKQVAQNYLDGSKVVDQEEDMCYDPNADLVVEYADPNYENLAESLQNSTNARILYMAFKRTRFLPKNAPVTLESLKAQVVFRGICCNLIKLVQNQLFENHTSNAFRAMVFAGILEKYREWHVTQVDEQVKVGALDSFVLQDRYEKLAEEICTTARDRIDEYDRLVQEACALGRQKRKANDAGQSVEQLQTNLARIVHNIVNHPTSQDHDFVHETELTVYVDRSRLYDLLGHTNYPVMMTNLRLQNFGDIKFVDKGESSCNAMWRAGKEKQYMETDDGRYPRCLLRREKAYGSFRRTNPAEILQMGFETFQYPLYIDSMSTLLLTDCILATTQPLFSARVRWSTIFEEEFGMLMRRSMAGFRIPVNELQQNMFIAPGGELMNLPRPFRKETCPALSDIILKSGKVVWSFARDPFMTGNGRMTPEEMRGANAEDLKVKLVEAIMMFGCLNPVFGSPASTVAYSQGSTHKGFICLDFGKVEKGDHLVSMTRSSDSNKLKVANVMAVSAPKNQQTEHERHREFLRKKISKMTSFYNFR